MSLHLVALLLALSGPAVLAEEHTTGPHISELPADQDTSISIRKGRKGNLEPDYEIVDGKDEISGDPVLGKRKAYDSWKEACVEWKNEMKESNRENRIIALGCNAPTASQEGTQTVYNSTGSYQIRVKLRQ